MKIDRGRLKKSSSEVPSDCQALIDKLRTSNRKDLFYVLKGIESWNFGKCELYHWIDVLDVLDDILEECAKRECSRSWILRIDLPEMEWERQLLLRVLNFTTLLIEHSFSRHLYNSVEHLISLLTSCNMSIVLAVLNLLYMFSKRSNFITRLSADKKKALISRLNRLAESWCAYDEGVTLAQSCRNVYLGGRSTLHYEFYESSKGQQKGNLSKSAIHIENIESLGLSAAELMDNILKRHPYLTEEKQLLLFSRLRLYINFPNYDTRLLCVQARLQATSVLAYTNAILDNAHTLLYNGFLEELVEVVQISDSNLTDIRAAALRTLTSITHLDRHPHFTKKPSARLNMIIEVTTANSFHGFLPTFVRSCVSTLLSDPQLNRPKCPFPLPLATALFSFLYHLASYDAGGEALVSSGMMECLLRVIHWHGRELEHITFVTRAVRVIDLITNIDMQSFQAHGGLSSFISRLEVEVNACRRDQPFVIKTSSLRACYQAQHLTSNANPLCDQQGCSTDNEHDVMEVDADKIHCDMGTSEMSHEIRESQRPVSTNDTKSVKTCLPQRAALLKSMLNFLKKAIQDSSFSDSVRNVMAGSLPSSLRHIISNAEYYGASLFLLATDVVTVYVFQEPSFLSTLQDDGLTYVIMNALLVKDVPATREVLGSLPNIFSALCLNARGLEAFIQYQPFLRLFKILVSPTYLGAMKRRKSSDPATDTPCNLGNAMDELIRHQPSLKAPAINAVNKLLDELYDIHQDPTNSIWRGNVRAEVPQPSSARQGGSSSSDEEDEDDASTLSHAQQEDGAVGERMNVPLVDYIINVMKFIDSILTNNSTDDHCREFISQGGIPRLMKILEICYLPLDHPVTSAGQAVATVCKSILNLTHEGEIFKFGLESMETTLCRLSELQLATVHANGSILLHELASQSNAELAFNSVRALPLLHGVNSVHGYVVMFLNLSRSSQNCIECLLEVKEHDIYLGVSAALWGLWMNRNELRTLALAHWGSVRGLYVLSQLKSLYKALVWESTVLLALCSEEVPLDKDFAREDLEKLMPQDKCVGERSAGNDKGMTTAMEALSTNDTEASQEICSEQRNSLKVPPNIVAKYIKPLLHASSRLGRALAELFGMLVKLSVGTPLKRRQRYTVLSRVLTPAAKDISESLAMLLVDCLSWTSLPKVCVPQFKLTYLICSVGFTSPLLFDEKKNPYYLMLYQFLRYGGHTAYFESFRKALTDDDNLPIKTAFEDPMLPEGTGEFLDAWLLLLEKMVNTKCILDSPYSHIYKGPADEGFDPAKFLFEVQKDAYQAVMLMWRKKPLKTYGTRMSETMFAILRHIIRGERIYQEMLNETIASRKKALLAKPPTPSSSDAAAAKSLSSTTLGVNLDHLKQLMDMGFTEDRCVVALKNTSGLEQATDYLLNHPSPLIQMGKVDEYVVISREALDEFSLDVFGSCMMYIDWIPETTYYAMDLLTAAAKRIGPHFRDVTINTVIAQVETYADKLFQECFDVYDKPSEVLSAFLESSTGSKLAARMHLLSLLLEELRTPCALLIVRRGIISSLVSLLELAEVVMRMFHATVAPKWLTHLLNLINAVERIKVSSERRDKMLQVTTNTWRWFDISTGKWNAYSAANNKIINDAFFRGDPRVKVSCGGRRRYVISFTDMVQTNEETGNSRPVTLSLKCRDKNDSKTSTKENLDEDMDVECADLSERRKPVNLQQYDTTRSRQIIRACVGLMKISLDRDTLHSAMFACIRLTRNYELAKAFIEAGGIQTLLSLTTGPFNAASLNMATILIRHAIEEYAVLKHTMEKVIRTQAQLNDPTPYKEILFFMLQTSSCVCRAPDMYAEIASDILRIDINHLSKRNDDEGQRLLVKCLPSKNTTATVNDDDSVKVVIDLLNALIEPSNSQDPEAKAGSSKVQEKGKSKESANSKSSKATEGSSSPAWRRPLLTKSAILKILADIAKSYSAFAKVISDHVYTAGQTELIKEECSALAFILDNFLMSKETADKECSTMARVLIVALASCNHATDVQGTVISEVKSALLRCVSWHECSEKHTRIQQLSALVSSIIYNSPGPVEVPRLHYSSSMNHIVKIMIRKGLVTDLAKITHSLDLCSSSLPNTMNSVLRTLEVVTRIINMPVASGNQKTTRSRSIALTDEHALEVQAAEEQVAREQAARAQAEREQAAREQGGNNTEGAAQNAQVEDLEQIARDAANAVAQDSSERTNSENQENREEHEGENVSTDASDRRDRAADDAMVLNSDYGAEVEVEVEPNSRGGDGTNTLSSAAEAQPPFRENSAQSMQFENRGTAELDSDDSDDSEPSDTDVNHMDDDEEGDENEEEGGSGYDEDNLEFFESDEDLFRIPGLEREGDDLLMIQYADPDSGGTRTGPRTSWNTNALPLASGSNEDAPNGNDTAGDIPASHPLVMARRNLAASTLSTSRTHRAMRQRHYQYLQMNTRSQNNAVILQRLLGPSAATAIELGIPISPVAITELQDSNIRVITSERSLGVISNPQSEEDQADTTEQPGFVFGPSLTATVSTIPTAMFWWYEECKLLDSDSQFSAVIGACHDVITELSKYKAEDLAQRKEMMKKKQEEATTRKKNMKRANASGETGATTGTRPNIRTITRRPLFTQNSAAENLADSIVESVLQPSLSVNGRQSNFSEQIGGSQNSTTESSSSANIQALGAELIAPLHSVIIQNSNLGVSGAYQHESSDQSFTQHIPIFRNSGSVAENPPQSVTVSETNAQQSSQASTSTSSGEQNSSNASDQRSSVTSSETARNETQVVEEVMEVDGQQQNREGQQNTRSQPETSVSEPSTTVTHSNDSDSSASNTLTLSREEVTVPGLSVTHTTLSSRFRRSPSGNLDSNNFLAPNAQSDYESNGEGGGETQSSRGMLPLRRRAQSGRRVYLRTDTESQSSSDEAQRNRPWYPQNNVLGTEDSPETSVTTSASTSSVGGSATSASSSTTTSTTPTTAAASSSSSVASTNSFRSSAAHGSDSSQADVSSAPSTSSTTAVVHSAPSVSSPVPGTSSSSLQPVATTSAGTSNAGSSDSGSQSAGGNPSELLEGVDPSFLAALPDDMREEVIAEQLRLQRLRQRTLQQTRDLIASNVSEVNPEFLAALPPSIQEEVLAQHHLEQQRQAAIASNPNDPVNAAEFFQNLPSSLRQTILTDMEESQMSVLPPDLAQEAQTLRREWEARNRQLMQDRFFSHVSHNTSALSSMLRNPGRVSSSSRYTIQSSAAQQRAQWNAWNAATADSSGTGANYASRVGSRALLDSESVACLLVLLFIDESSLNMGRLHRVLRNLCYHPPTRDWILKALLSILEKCSFAHKNSLPEPKRMTTRSQSQSPTPNVVTVHGAWLNTTFNYALGRVTEVFSLVKYPTKRGPTYITLQTRACPVVFRHTVDVLISMAKGLPVHFLLCLKSRDIDKKKEANKDNKDKKDSTDSKSKPASSSSPATGRTGKQEAADFWDVLLKLESQCTKKGKSVARPNLPQNTEEEEEMVPSIFEGSAFGKLFSLLRSTNITQNKSLIDKLLKLLAHISVGLPEIVHTDMKSGEPSPKDELLPISKPHMKLAVDVLTSRCCSEDGLEDITSLFLNLANCFYPAKYVILDLLVEGAMELGKMLKQHIGQVLKDLKATNKRLKRQHEDDTSPTDKLPKGTLMDRFTKHSVVINAPVKGKGRYDWSVTNVHLLTSKTSSQAFFLRTLKVIVQIRESIRAVHKRQKDLDEKDLVLPHLANLLPLDDLWDVLSSCLTELSNTPDSHAVLVLQPAVEAFFLVHTPPPPTEEKKTAPKAQEGNQPEQAGASTSGVAQQSVAPVSPLPPDSEASANPQSSPSSSRVDWESLFAVSVPRPPTKPKFLVFAETHRVVLNEILRQSTINIADGPFAVLVDHTRILDFDVKRRYFRSELERMDEGIRREELAVHVRRSHVFEDSFRELHRRSADEWKNRFYIVFEGEEGQDAGGLLREWYVIISREIFNPMYALFTTSPGDRVTYMINSSSHCNPNHLCYFKFVGRVIAKAIYDNKLLECYFTRSFYKHILGIPVKYTDMESEDYTFYQGLVYLMENHISSLGYDLTFSAEVQEFGVTDVRDLIPHGRYIQVCEENKMDYIRLVCQMKMTGAIRKQIYAFLEGFYDIIPKRLISIFNEQELELLISGMPNVDIEDLKANTEYHKYSPTSLQIQWFWRALRDFDQANRAKFLQFVTGTSKVPLQGFAALEGMNGVQKFQIHRDDRSTDRLPSAHTCFNQLDLPVYETYDKLRTYLLKAIHECSEGFGFA